MSSGEPSPDNVTLIQSPEQQAKLTGAVGVPGFELGEQLGRGGMGVVYKATQVGLNRIVALKMLIAGQYADPSLRARFLLEAESVAALEHPHIIRVFAFGEHGGHPYLAMEYVPGGTLAERIKKNGPLPAKDATELMAKLAAAVAHAHSRGVVHRDIKPLNVLLSADGEPRLTDFGLAKVGRADQNLSVTGQVLGTPAYMAPEQAAGKVHEVGTAADVYALGAVLYDLLTGRPPFTGDSAAVTLQKVMTEEPSRPRKLNASIPRDLETICLKCLEKEPAKRYARAADLGDDLQRALEGRPTLARPCGPPRRAYKAIRRNRLLVLGLLALPLALLLGTLLGALAFDRIPGVQPTTSQEPAAEPQPVLDSVAPAPAPPKPVVYTAGTETDLFEQSVLGWAGGPLELERDEEKVLVLTALRTTTRKLPDLPHFGVVLGLDPYKATTVDVVLAAGGGPPTTQWLVRIDRATGAAFGKRHGSTGAFEPAGTAVPVPTAEERTKEGRSPYLELRYERAGGMLTAWFDSQLLGSTSGAGLRANELHFVTTGGPFRIVSASVRELVEQK